MQGGAWSIARSPGPGFERSDGEIVYLLFHKKLTALGERATTIVDRRVAAVADLQARQRAVAELKEIAEK